MVRIGPARGVGTLLAALVVTTALADCSSRGGAPGLDSDLATSSSGALRCGMGTGTKAAGTPIKIGAIATMSNGVDFSSAPLTAKAYFDCVNANGGIHGRPVSYAFDDDGMSPQKASALAAKFAADQQVVAMAGGASFVACGLEQAAFGPANLFDILAVGVPKTCFYSANIAPVNSGARLSLISAMQYLHDHEGVQTVGAVGLAVPNLGDWEMSGVAAYAARSGVKVVWTATVPPPVKDGTTLAANLRSKAPQAFVIAMPAPSAASVLKAAQQQDLRDRIMFACVTSCYDTTFPGQIGPYWNESFHSNSEFTLVDAKTPDNLAWRHLLSAYGTPDQPRDSFSQAGFLSAKILTDTLLALQPADLTRAGVSRAIQGIKNYRSDMLCRPWYVGPGHHHNANHDLRNVRVGTSGTYVLTADCSATSDPDLSDILALESEPALGLVG